MSESSNTFAPDPSTWFSPNIEYEGHGHVAFGDPPRVAEGPIRIRFDEFGGSSIEVRLDNIDPFTLHTLLTGEQPKQQGNARWIGIGGAATYSTCMELSATTSTGIYTATGQILLTGTQQQGNNAVLHFRALQSRFDALSAQQAIYWVLPLSNFLSDFAEAHSALDRHPLRIYPTCIFHFDFINHNVHSRGTLAIHGTRRAATGPRSQRDERCIHKRSAKSSGPIMKYPKGECNG